MLNRTRNAGSSTGLRTVYVLSLLLAAVVIVQAAGGLFMKGLYRDNAWVISIFIGTDFVTLVIAVPVLLVALAGTMRGSLRARLVLIAMHYYVFYNNMYYLFSAFNYFFLVYVALCIVSAGALIATLPGTAGRIKLSPGRYRKPVCLAMFACAAVIAANSLGHAVMFTVNGRLPQIIIDSGGTTDMVAIFDLTMIVPLLVLGGIWLWQARSWGILIATVMIVQCAMVTVNLTLTPPFQAAAGVKDAWTMVPLFASLGVIFLVSSAVMLKNIKAQT